MAISRGVRLKALVRWSNGVAISAGQTKLMFDPLESDPIIPQVFISHAHYDHSRGFQFPTQTKYSTKETQELYEVDSGRKVENWQQVRLGRRLKLDEVEVEAHDAGHVLGSAQFEVITPESNVVYASHINFVDTLLSHAAQVAPCDVLVLETNFASPSQGLPPRESTIAQMVKWTMECVIERRIPTFVTDPIGNAQELIRIFNTWTELRVIVHPRIARASKVYENNGIGLRYTDASTEESQNLIENAKCIVIAPRGFDATRFGDFRVANVSRWKSRVEDSATTDFRLSDQADFDQLLRFVEEARPKKVLTFRGASRVFAQLVSKKLGVPANELVASTSLPKPPTAKLDETRVSKCGDLLREFVETPGFTYQRQDLLALGMREGFRGPEIEEALFRLVRTGALTYSELLEGYRLSAE
jgi:putative mRNA 3-end processing factor